MRGRQQWRAWLLLTLLVTTGTGVTLAAITAGRRADSAFPDFVAAHGYDAVVYAAQPLPLTSLPDVTQAVRIDDPFYGQPWCSCGKRIDQSDLSVREVPPAALPRLVELLSGQRPDQADPHEVLASYTLQRDYGIGPGTLIRLPLAAASQTRQVVQTLTGGPAPARYLGPVVTLRVTGIVAAEDEFPSGQGTLYDLYPTAAFAAATKSTPAVPIYDVRLRHGQSDFARFEATVSGRDQAGVADIDTVAAAITASIHPQAVAWWVVAALAALAAVTVIGQALARQAAADDADGPVLAALGLRPGQFTAQHLLRTLVLAVIGVAAGVGVATLLSAFTPVGEARLATPTPGLVFDGPPAAAGGAAAVAGVLLLGLPPALRTARQRAARRSAPVARRSRVAGASAAAGLPITAVLGLRQAFDPGRAAVPVRAGLAGAVGA
ncbi:MAG TPA: FtsX-like permease family protein, partial [Trebonia sp.]